MDAIDLLEKDHRKVETLFQRFNDGGGLTGVVKRLTGNAASARQKRSLAEQVCSELDVHAAIEESTFYPAIRGLRDERLDELLDESLREHGSIKDGVQEVRAALDDESRLGTAMSALQQCVDHHVREEEGEMFPRVTDVMPESERADLGRQLTERKRVVMPSARRATPAARARKRTVKRAQARSGATARRVRKTTVKAKKPRTAAKSRAARRR
jgi:hemerythrin superfamily protein